jgi:hypothetical protein
MSMPKSTKIMTIAQEIDRYLAKHPNAADTLTGVTRWWLARQRYDETVEDVQAALEYLETRQTIVRQTNSDGTIIYRSFSPASRVRH